MDTFHSNFKVDATLAHETVGQLVFSQPLTPNRSASVEKEAKDAAVKPKRPLNSFMLFRQEMYPKLIKKSKVYDHRQLSRMVAGAWHALSFEDRKIWADRADALQRAHQQLYPDYRFKPKQNVDKKKRKTYGNTPRHRELLEEIGVRTVLGQACDDVVQEFGMVEEETQRPTRRERKPKGPVGSLTYPGPPQMSSAAARGASEESYSSGGSTSSHPSNIFPMHSAVEAMDNDSQIGIRSNPAPSTVTPNSNPYVQYAQAMPEQPTFAQQWTYPGQDYTHTLALAEPGEHQTPAYVSEQSFADIMGEGYPQGYTGDMGWTYDIDTGLTDISLISQVPSVYPPSTEMDYY